MGAAELAGEGDEIALSMTLLKVMGAGLSTLGAGGEAGRTGAWVGADAGVGSTYGAGEGERASEVVAFLGEGMFCGAGAATEALRLGG